MEQPTGSDRSLEQLVGLVTLTIIIILVVIFWLIKPQIVQLKDVNAQVAAKNQELLETQQKLTNMNSLSTELKTKKDLVDKLNIVLPLNDPAVAELILQLTNIAKNSGVDIKTIVPSSQIIEETSGAPSPTGGDAVPVITPYSFSFTITGTYSTAKAFFANLEKNLRPVKVQNINISSASEGADPALSFSINAETYYQKAIIDNSTNSSSSSSTE